MAGKRRRGASAEPEQEDDDDDEEEEEAEEAENFDEEAARKAAKRMKVAELRAALEELGETPDGSKPELVEQLVAAQCAAAAEGGGEEDDGNDSGEEEEDEPNVCDMEDRALLEEAVKLAREIKKKQQQNDAGQHDIICVAPSTCGHCKEDVKGTQYYCKAHLCSGSAI